MSLFNIYIEHFKLLREKKSKPKKKKKKKKKAPPVRCCCRPGGKRAVIQCRLCGDQMCRVLVEQMKGWGEGGLSPSLYGAQEQFLQLNWHLFPPSPAGPVSAPCSTEPLTGTTCRETKKETLQIRHKNTEERDCVMLATLLLDLWGAVHKIMAPELKGRVLDQLYEGDEKTPWVRPVHN